MTSSSPHFVLLATARHALDQGLFEMAENNCAQILVDDPDHAEALLILGTVYARTGKVAQGIQTLEELIAVDPKSVPGLNWLAALYRAAGRFEESIAYCEQATQVKPTDAESYNNLGQSLEAALSPARAAQAFQRASVLNPRLPLYRRNYIRALVRAGQDGAAEAAIRGELRSNAADMSLHALLAQIIHKRDGLERAGAYCREAYLATADPQKKLEFGLALSALSELELAEETLRALVQDQPQFGAANMHLGQLLQQRGAFSEANEFLQQAIDLEPNTALPYFLRILRNRTTEDDRPVLAHMEEMAEEPNRSWEDLRCLRYALGKAHDDLGDYAEAIGHFDEANRIALEHLGKQEPFKPEALVAHVDEQIAIFGQAFFDRHRGIGSPSELPIFIVGMMRSGTTLVKQILSSHPQVGPGTEIQFWAEQGKQCLDVERGTVIPERLQTLCNEYLSVLNEIGQGRIRVTDKMPHNYLVLGRIHLAFPNARIIHCRRHPVDTALSIWFTPFQYTTGYTFDRDHIVFAYRQYERLMSHWRSVLPADRFLEIDYEELVGNNERVVRHMVDFCGLEWSDSCLRHHENKAAIHTASLWQARQPIYDRSIGRWKSYEPWLGAFRELLDERLAA